MARDHELPPMFNSKKKADGHDAKKCGGKAHQALTEIGKTAQGMTRMSSGKRGTRTRAE